MNCVIFSVDFKAGFLEVEGTQRPLPSTDTGEFKSGMQTFSYFVGYLKLSLKPSIYEICLYILHFR